MDQMEAAENNNSSLVLPMTHHGTNALAPSGQRRRRRKNVGEEHRETASVVSSAPANNKNDYYDDDDEEDKYIHSSTCSFGRFMINPCHCMATSLYTCLCKKHKNARVCQCHNNNISQWFHQNIQSNDKIKRLTRRLSQVVNRHNKGGVQKNINAFCALIQVILLRTRTRVLNINRRTKTLASILLVTILLGCVMVKDGVLFHRRKRKFKLREYTRKHRVRAAAAKQGRLLIPRLDLNKLPHDLGGWKYYPAKQPFPLLDRRAAQRRRELAALAKQSEKEEGEDTDDDDDDEENDINTPDYGDLIIRHAGVQRVIHPRDYERYEEELEETEELQESLKDDWRHNARRFGDDDSMFRQDCRRNSWARAYYPNCNHFHEFDLSREHYNEEDTPLPPIDRDYHTTFLSHGYFRDAVSLKSTRRASTEMEYHSILKLLRFSFQFGPKDLAEAHADALIMERLTKSPRIVNIYGHCGSAVNVEFMPKEVEDFVIPDGGYINQKDIPDSQGVHPMNDLTVARKLQAALEMAESLADLHGYEGGLIIHDDVQLCQWLETSDGHVKLGDFNRATIMLYSESQGEYCTFKNGRGYGNFRAPEEFANLWLNEKIDVYSFGNLIYTMLTGLWPFYEDEDDGVVHEKVMDGKRAFVDERYRTHSYVEGRLVELMERCWAEEPDDRPDIFEIVAILKDVVSKEQKEQEAER